MCVCMPMATNATARCAAHNLTNFHTTARCAVCAPTAATVSFFSYVPLQDHVRVSHVFPRAQAQGLGMQPTAQHSIDQLRTEVDSDVSSLALCHQCEQPSCCSGGETTCCTTAQGGGNPRAGSSSCVYVPPCGTMPTAMIQGKCCGHTQLPRASCSQHAGGHAMGLERTQHGWRARQHTKHGARAACTPDACTETAAVLHAAGAVPRAARHLLLPAGRLAPARQLSRSQTHAAFNVSGVTVHKRATRQAKSRTRCGHAATCGSCVQAARPQQTHCTRA
jgi:hypothetical protein